MFQIYHTIIIAIILQNHAQLVKHIKLDKVREYRKKLAIFELIGLVQSEKQALKTVCYEKVPFPNMARTNGMDYSLVAFDPAQLTIPGTIITLARKRVPQRLIHQSSIMCGRSMLLCCDSRVTLSALKYIDSNCHCALIGSPGWLASKP